MKKFKIYAFIFLIILAILAILVISYNVSKASTSDIREKTLSEIKYFESQLIDMFNALNNIDYENYKLSVEDVNSKSEESSTKKYDLNPTGVLIGKQDVDWDYIQQKAEILESSISSMTLDLYEISLNANDILNFNKEYDNLLLQIKKQDKTATLKSLSALYSYILKFVKNCNKDENNEILINTKLNVLLAYSILDSEDWNSINKYLQLANTSFSRLLTDINIRNRNQYIINKCYISLNNLQNCTELKDKEIFLIKYKNLLEDLNNI